MHRLPQLEGTYRSYVDRAVIATRMNLQAELDGKVVMIKVELQQQLNGGQGERWGVVAGYERHSLLTCSKSQDKMWGAISRMGEDLQGLAAREKDSDSEHEEGEAAAKDSPGETPMPHTVTSPIPLFGMPPPSVHVDVASVRDSVSFAVPR